MPLYEYQCEKCGKIFEAIQKFSDEPLTKHQDCGGKLDKLMSAPAFHLKGSGWYVTDYGKGGSKDTGKDSGKESSSEAKSESKSESSSDSKTDSTKSDAKTETKTEAKPKDKPAAATS